MRAASLIPLTHDHHHALAACRRLRLAANEGEPARAQGAGAFLEFFGTDVVAHFREEEELLFPLIVNDDSAQEVLQRVMMEHLHLHTAVGDLSNEADTMTPSSSSMRRVAALLENHVRFEERTVFPLVELLVGEEGLRQLSLSPRNRNAQVMTTH